MGKRKPAKKVTQGAKLKEVLRTIRFFENKCAHCEKPAVKDELFEEAAGYGLCESCRKNRRREELICSAQAASSLIEIAHKAVFSVNQLNLEGKNFNLERKLRAIHVSLTGLKEQLLDIESGRLI